MSRLISAVLILWIGWAFAAQAQSLRALARVNMEASTIRDNGRDVVVELALTQAVPYRIFTLDAPRRVVVDFREVAFESGIAALDRSDRVTAVAAGAFRPGWSRLVLELDTPMAVISAALETDPNEGDAVVRLSLSPVEAEKFAATAGAPSEEAIPAITPNPPKPAGAPLVVVLDPGHGGVDPGAQRQGVDEADLMLQFARELREALLRAGDVDVLMTRDSDIFVSLPARVSIARAAQADLFISLHADALADGRGRATGTTIYTLSDDASDAASADLAERQDRLDILAGVDLRAHDDQIATVLMDLARQETAPRTDRLATEMVTGLRNQLGRLHKRPRLKAGFSVLKAPDIPSVLIELGFISSQSDLENLLDPVWRSQAAEGIVEAISAWAVEDAALRGQSGQ